MIWLAAPDPKLDRRYFIIRDYKGQVLTFVSFEEESPALGPLTDELLLYALTTCVIAMLDCRRPGMASHRFPRTRQRMIAGRRSKLEVVCRRSGHLSGRL